MVAAGQGTGSSRFESLILSNHSRFNITCECNKEEINDDDVQSVPLGGIRRFRYSTILGVT